MRRRTTGLPDVDLGPAGPNAHLVGRAGSRLKLDTPALVLDLDALERNVLRMAEWAKEAGIRLRPHVKSHKSSRIARLQRDAGASGFCCATIGEAEVLAAAGIGNLLITSPLVTRDKLDRAMAILMRDPGLCLVADNFENVALISEAAQASGRTVQVMVDVDPGMQRTGAATQRTAIELVGKVAASRGLSYAGLQCYAGHLQHMADIKQRQEATLAVMGALRVLCEELKAAGLEPVAVSGGGTGTYAMDAEAGVLTELQVGSYVFMDSQYNEVWLADNLEPPFDAGLFVQASVISNNHPTHVTCDAGLKHLAVDGGPPVVAHGADHGSAYTIMGDVHGRLSTPAGARAPELQARVELIAPHCDPTVNLFDQYHCVRGDRLVDIWPVDARGV